MASKSSPNIWKEAIDSLHFTDTVESVKIKLSEISKDYTYDQFIADCEAFYQLYIDFIGFNDDKSPSKNLQIQFHKVARLLNLQGHVPDVVEEESLDSMFKYLAQPEQEPNDIVKTANSNTNQDDHLLQNNLAFGLSNDLPTDNVDLVGIEKDKVVYSSAKVINVKVANDHLGTDPQYINSLKNIYRITDNFIDYKFDRDKLICSLYYR